ncbi:MAG: glucose-1-phosphate adenylyltransferase [Chitinivibrionales bacterium]|nr:glucose-1-phosphate adenylyltransferase [Chitinivibrionales bacterium]
MAIKNRDVLVLILGGGKGSRLYPLTKKRAKPAVNFGGKYRLIDIPITNCLRSGFKNIFILTQFNSFSLNRHIWQAYSQRIGHEGFIDVIAAQQTNHRTDWFQGTADAVRQTLEYVVYHRPKYVLILSGDQVYSMDYQQLLLWHSANGSQITIAANYTPANKIHELGIVKVAPDYQVIDFYEKPATVDEVEEYKINNVIEHPAECPFLGSMGLYLFDTDILIKALDNNEVDFGKTVIPEAANNFDMRCFPFEGYWEDVGTIKALYEANMEWLRGGGISHILQGGNSIVTNSRHLPPTKINNTTITDSLIADGGNIQAAQIKGSIIGVRTRVDRNTCIEDSIITGNDSPQHGDQFEIGENCTIKGAIIDKNAHIGAGSTLANYSGVEEAEHDLYMIRSGIIAIPQDTVIPPNFAI